MNTFNRIPTLMVPLSVALFAIAAQTWGDTTLLALRYHREAVAGGELWRLITGHLVHLNVAHLIGNLAGLWIIWLLVGPLLNMRDTLLILLIAAASCDLGFWLFNPELQWYVGLSGVLHGLLLGGALQLARQQRWMGIGIALLVFAKLLWEQVVGPLASSEALIQNRVVVDAHLYGAIGGATAAGIIRWLRPGSLSRG